MSDRPLSFDHKPMDTKERARIESAGGFVEFNRFQLYTFYNLYFYQSEWELGIVEGDGGLCIQDERQTEPGFLTVKGIR